MRQEFLGKMLFAAALAFILASPPASAVTIYQDDFSGDGLSSLNGAAPDVTPGAETWASGSHLLNNGVQDGAGRFTALLPIALEQGGVYTLSADFTATGGAGQWLAMGFAEALAPTGAGLGERWISNGSNAALWALVRAQGTTGTNFDQSFLGYAAPAPGPTGGGAASTTISATSLIITIDTTNPDWAVTWDFNGDGVDRTETVLAANRPNINYVGFSSTDAAGTATITSFLLDGPAPPSQWVIDGGGSFNTPGNWSAGSVPSAIAVFGGSLTTPNAPAVVTIDTAVSLNEVRFANTNQYELAGPAALTLTGDAILNVSTGTHVVSATINGSTGFQKTGNGDLIIDGTNGYSGQVDVLGGVLRPRAVGSLTAGTVDVSAGASLFFEGDDLGGGYSGTVPVTITGSGQVGTSVLLTTETVTFNTAHTYSGQTTVNGGTLEVTPGGTLGASDGTAATRTFVNGNQADGILALSGGVTVSSELLVISGRQLAAEVIPHLTSSGNNTWTGNILGTTGGNFYNIESTSGELTLTGTISGPTTSGRNFVFSGTGDITVDGRIYEFNTDANGNPLATPDNSENNINVIKRGTGTLTIATSGADGNDYHQGTTVIEQGTLSVESGSELRSSSIDIQSQGILNIVNFGDSTYDLQVGQALSGGGQINLGANTLNIYDDNQITPGDSVGTLNINGAVTLNGVGGGGTLFFELGNTPGTVGGGENDLIDINGSLTTSGTPTMTLNVAAAEGEINGTYTVIRHTIGGAVATSGFTPQIVGQNGQVLNTRESLTVSSTAGQVNLTVNGSDAQLTWNGSAGNTTWDVATTNPWSGSQQFFDLDDVTFAAGGTKTVVVADTVTPGVVNFTSASTYTFTGSGGISGGGAVNVNNGTVRFQNSGNDYRGTTTVASAARLEMNSGTTGDMNVNGTLSIGSAGVAVGGAQTFFANAFGGTGAPLNGSKPDTSWDGSNWVAAAFFEDDGDSINSTAGGSATLGFTPVDGSTYVLETSISNITGDSDWFGLGFVNGQSTATSANSRFILADVEGIAWALYRGDASVNANQVFLGNSTAAGNGGLASGAEWLVDGNTSGGSVDLRITLDTTGGSGNWTATWEADTGSGYQTIRATATLLDQLINAVGIANSNSADLTGTIESFSLTGVEPANTRLAGQTLTVDGDLTMGSNALLEFDIAFIGQDFLNVTGLADLNGSIDVTKLGSFTPENGSEYTILSAAGGILDSGVTYNLPANFTASIVDMTDLVLTYMALGLAGDFNGDGVVDAADYTVWRDNLGAIDETAFAAGSGNGGGIDSTDYDQWRANFGNTSGSLATDHGAVPEPDALILLLATLGCGVALRGLRG